MSRKSRRRRSRTFEATGHAVAMPETSPEQPAAPPSVHVIAYGPDGVVEDERVAVTDLRAFLDKWPVTWVDVAGLGDPELVRKIGEVFELHPLAVEDVLHVHQRPKVEPYGDKTYVVLRMADWTGSLETEQISLFLGKSWVLTFQEDRPGDCFGGVRDRLRLAKGPLRASGPDLLMAALADSIIDSQFPVLETLGERLEDLEGRILDKPVSSTAHEIQAVKRDLLLLRRIAWPTREAMGIMHRDPSPLVGAEARLALRDSHDHAVQIMDLVETFREVASGLMELYLSSVSNRMNEIMKVLTIIATIFMPLSFIAGVYGMNFNTAVSHWNMPELNWRFGYPFALGIMASVAIGFLWYFGAKGWLTGGGERK